MLAPKVTKPQTETAKSSNPIRNRPGRGHEQEDDPANLTSRGAAPSVSWDFSKVPIFPPDRANSQQASPPLTAPHPSSLIQPKLAIGRVDDPLEHEADRTADQIMRMPAPEVSVSAGVEEEQKALNLQTKPVTTLQTPSVAPGLVHEVLHSRGQPLDPVTQAFFEPRFGYDFSRVRVHADAQAADSARALGALAYTVGADITFGHAHYQPNTTAGRRLLAHELAHTIQQAAGPVVQRSPDSGSPGLPWYQRQQLEALEQKISGWTEYEKALARSLLTQWFALRNAGSRPDLIWTALSEQLLTQYTQWLVEADAAMQAYCRDHGLSVSEKLSGATCEPMFGEGHTSGQFKIDSFRSYIKLTSNPEDVPLYTAYFWAFEYRRRTNPEIMAQADMIQSVLTGIALGVGRVPEPTPSTPVPPSGGGGPSRSLPAGRSPPKTVTGPDPVPIQGGGQKSPQTREGWGVVDPAPEGGDVVRPVSPKGKTPPPNAAQPDQVQQQQQKIAAGGGGSGQSGAGQTKMAVKPKTPRPDYEFKRRPPTVRDLTKDPSMSELADELEGVSQSRETAKKGSKQMGEKQQIIKAGQEIESPTVQAWKEMQPKGVEVLKNADFPPEIKSIYPETSGAAKSGPDAISINRAKKEITVFDSTTKSETGHERKTVGDAQKLKDNLPAEYKGYKVFAQEGWTDGGLKLSPRKPI
jgi:Domain of unknown function (DUF4157)